MNPKLQLSKISLLLVVNLLKMLFEIFHPSTGPYQLRILEKLVSFVLVVVENEIHVLFFNSC